ncbi:MAG TPA: WbqC family protein, partial [Flavitalea sp.]|nr:WbqC family protein [Flavitalea sp.]
RAHFRTLLSCYNRSAFFEHYRDGLEVLFQKDTSWLVEWNLACFEWVIDQLKLDVIVGKTSSFQSKYEDTQHHDFRGLLRPGHYAVPGISTVEYAQVFMERSAFVPGLSILDMLFCEGPRASRILKQMAGM